MKEKSGEGYEGRKKEGRTENAVRSVEVATFKCKRTVCWLTRLKDLKLPT